MSYKYKAYFIWLDLSFILKYLKKYIKIFKQIVVDFSNTFSVKIAKVNLNDKIVWKSSSKGHNVEFVETPKGVKKFKSKINKDATYEFKIPGVYLYQCTPHKAMGMIGIVVVGDDKSNLDKIKKVKMRGKSKKILKELLKEL